MNKKQMEKKDNKDKVGKRDRNRHKRKILIDGRKKTKSNINKK